MLRHIGSLWVSIMLIQKPFYVKSIFCYLPQTVVLALSGGMPSPTDLVKGLSSMVSYRR